MHQSTGDQRNPRKRTSGDKPYPKSDPERQKGGRTEPGSFYSPETKTCRCPTGLVQRLWREVPLPFSTPRNLRLWGLHDFLSGPILWWWVKSSNAQSCSLGIRSRKSGLGNAERLTWVAQPILEEAPFLAGDQQRMKQGMRE